MYSAAESKKEDAEVTALRESLQGLQIASRAKVTQDRVYSVAYHPEKSKDLIFFGGELCLRFYRRNSLIGEDDADLRFR